MAVLFLRQGTHKGGISIVTEGVSLGRTWHRPPPVSFQPEFDASPAVEARIVNMAKVCYAGFAAEKLQFGHRIDSTGCASDFSTAISLLDYISGSNREVKAWSDLLMIQTEMMLTRPVLWRAVHGTAQLLVKHGSIKYKDVKPLLKVGLVNTKFAKPPFPPAM